MHIVCLDLEGVIVPEIWILMARKTGIEELQLTTRDIADYNVLMQNRLRILSENNLKLKDLQDVIATMEPLEGAADFLQWLRARTQVIIISDTFTQFATPLMKKLGWPTLFCHSLEVAPDGAISNYRLRQPDAKKKSVEALKQLNYQVLAVGDSYNDIPMLQQAHHGLLFHPPESVIKEYPDFPVFNTYTDLQQRLQTLLDAPVCREAHA